MMNTRWPQFANMLASHFPSLRSRPEKPKLYHSIPLDSETIVPRRQVPEHSGPSMRPLKWLGFDQFVTLVSESRDLIVIDLRAGAQWRPFPVSNVFVLPVAPYELPDLMDRLPMDRSVVLYGSSVPVGILAEASTCMQGTATLYVVDDDRSRRVRP